MPDAREEWHGLWLELFGEPPSIEAPSTLLAQVLVDALPPAPPYRPGRERQRPGAVYRRAGGR